jgi:hypothetical protein
MKRMTTFVLVTAALILSACGGGGSSGYGDPSPPAATPPPPPPPAAAQTNFTAFMRTQLDATATSDASEPRDVESANWVFTDDDDESEYEDVLATSM